MIAFNPITLSEGISFIIILLVILHATLISLCILQMDDRIFSGIRSISIYTQEVHLSEF